MNNHFHIVIFPETRGKKGYPKICMFVRRGFNGYIVRGFCEDYSCWEFHAERDTAINRILLKIYKNLREKK
ncbi:hypothetical protein HNR53_002800 [Bacillus benzoevorans]|uniref:Transposase n=1 Tax=Bacillus benzoevorans TaxID=1456 RepID=A0A7X0HUZ0_9BACI|nr:hypothetical protein [Bacillus benzoevorans]